MPTMTALEAKNAFGQFLDAAQRAPVTVTKNGRAVGAMFSQADLEAMGAAFLMEPLREAVEDGMPISDALLRQVEMERRIALAEEDIAAGRVHVGDAAFYDELRAYVRSIAAK